MLQSVFLRCLRATVCAVWGQQWSVVGKAGTNTKRQPETNRDKQTKAQTDKQGQTDKSTNRETNQLTQKQKVV